MYIAVLYGGNSTVEISRDRNNKVITFSSHIGGQDPLFVKPESGDYHLQAKSPCIDTVSTSKKSLADDMDSTTRPQKSKHDQGAYEYKAGKK